VVRDPTIAGLFFKDTAGLLPSEIHPSGDFPPNTVPELVRVMSERHGLPVFAVRHTGVYRVDAWDETGRYDFGQTIKANPASLTRGLSHEE